jgi:uncharacterized tellurite resistance protein B-like protein
MIDAVKKLLKRYFSGVKESPPDKRADAVQLAVAALLVQLTGVDFEANAAEREAVLEAVRSELGLDEASAQALVGRAEEAARRATSDWQFTSVIKGAFDAEERVHFVEHLGRVAFADRQIDPHEEHLVRRIADLLYVSHSDFIAAKLRAKARP